MSEAIQKSLDTSATMVVPPLSEKEKADARRLVYRTRSAGDIEGVQTILHALGLLPYDETLT